jgi:hypothetical protein
LAIRSPASDKISAILSAVNGVSSAGLTTQVHPAASAGAIFRQVSVIGAFHGTMKPQTPMGDLRVKACMLL